ncbi:hypothetical protein [Acinetobacter sp. YH01022]|uniref:hypothetical protein n=1 Tax=Acinetobacter sp. YH01022 TaxID=2601036 RepID=UPI0015D2177E|nr:hypothetical protein [Acinetobacter sp. YH01022]
MKDFIKQNLGRVINWALTLGWVGFVFYLWQYSGIKKPDELNEIGDFLAGVFAPLAFFWLVRGFYQQGKGLEQNSISLKLQADELQASTEALQLQVQEMKASVEQQKIMAEFQRLEIEERHNSVIPVMNVEAALNLSNLGYSFHFSIQNLSDNDARNIIIETNVADCSSNHSEVFPILLKGNIQHASDSFTDNESSLYKQDILFERIIHLSYESILGKKFHEEYLLEVGKSIHPTHRKITRTK